MKKRVIQFLAILFFCLLFFVPLSAQLRYGVKAGLSLTDMPYPDGKTAYSSNAIFGEAAMPRMNFLVGGVAEYDLQRYWTLSAELQFGSRGYREKIDNGQQSYTEFQALLWYVQIPLSFNFRWNGLFAGAGPYLGVALAGKNKTTYADGVDPQVTFNESARFGNEEDDDFRRVDGGLYAQAGYSFRNFRLSAAACIGLLDQLPAFYADFLPAKARQQVFSVAAAYYFGIGE